MDDDQEITDQAYALGQTKELKKDAGTKTCEQIENVSS